MDEFFYIVTQVWFDPQGNPGTQGFIFKEEEGQLPAMNRALSKFHDILSTGAISEDQYHAAMVTRSDGGVIKAYEYYDRRPEPQPEPEPEPQPEPEPESEG